MRNVESRPAAAFVLAYCPCVITKEKDHDEAGSPRKKDRESNEAKRTGIQKEEEEARRKKKRGGGAERKERYRTKNEVKRDQEDPEEEKKRGYAGRERREY